MASAYRLSVQDSSQEFVEKLKAIPDLRTLRSHLEQFDLCSNLLKFEYLSRTLGAHRGIRVAFNGRHGHHLTHCAFSDPNSSSYLGYPLCHCREAIRDPIGYFNALVTQENEAVTFESPRQKRPVCDRCAFTIDATFQYTCNDHEDDDDGEGGVRPLEWDEFVARPNTIGTV